MLYWYIGLVFMGLSWVHPLNIQNFSKNLPSDGPVLSSQTIVELQQLWQSTFSWNLTVASTQDFPSRFEQIPALRARIASPNSANQIFLHWVCSCIFQRSVVWDLEHHDKRVHVFGGEFLIQPPARPFWWRVLYATKMQRSLCQSWFQLSSTLR